MHRSGTSAIAGLLACLGCAAPKTVLGASRYNETGYWESAPVNALNDRLLLTIGDQWSEWTEIGPKSFKSPEFAALEKTAQLVVGSEYGAAALFVLKDPRICRLAPFWFKALAAVGIDAAVVMPIRSPAEVAASLAARSGIPTARALLVWLRHVLEAEFASRGKVRAFTSYSTLLADWRGVAAELGERLDIAWPRPIDRAALEIEALLRESLRHHRLGIEALACDDISRHWLETAFQVFERWSCAGEDEAGRRMLDDVRGDFNRFSPMLRAQAATDSAALAEKDALLRGTRARLEASDAAHRETMQRVLASHDRMLDTLLHGFDHLHLPRRVREVLTRRSVRRSGVVEGSWYLAHNEDVARAGLDPVAHYVSHGHREGRKPSSLLEDI